MLRTLMIPVCVTALTLISASAWAQEEERESNSAKLMEQISWIAGDWHGEAMGGTFEESWSPPSGGSMMGMFKMINDDKVVFYEILTIVPTKDDSLVLRLKHFHPDLKGWEEKDDSVEFPFVSVSEKEAKFDGLRFVKTAEDKMEILVTMKQGEKTSEVKFACQRRAKK